MKEISSKEEFDQLIELIEDKQAFSTNSSEPSDDSIPSNNKTKFNNNK